MSITFEYRPLSIFVPFHQSTERERCIVGGYGSGKSTAGCAEAIAIGMEQPGSEILVTRKTVPSLKSTTEKMFLDLLPNDFLAKCDIRKAGGHLDTLEFPNGSLYYFRGMDDWRKLKSMNLAFIFWDEADEFTPEDFEGMQSRIRQPHPTKKARSLGHTSIARRGMILACNPRGKNWIYQRFVDEQSKAPNTAAFISTTLDNPYLPIDYVQTLLNMPDPWVRAFVLCKFDDLVGAIYPDFNYDDHVVRPLERYDPDNFFVMGFDPGTSSGNAALWCYYDKGTHRLIGVAEYLETGLAASVHAKAWRAIEQKHRMNIRYRIADPKPINMRDRGSNVKLSDQYRRLGYSFQMGTNDVDTRITSLGQLIHLRRFVLTDDCMQTFEQLKNYRWADLTPQQEERGVEPKAHKKNVDLVDAAQYIACRYITPPKALPPADPVRRKAQETAAAIRRQLARRQSATSAHDLGSIHV